MKKIIILALTSILAMGCASTDESTNISAETKKKKVCKKVKVTGSSLPKKICKST